jgi:heme-degrading monooxygenase HmoA
MFIAMNRSRVAKGSEAAFEQVWMSRASHLDKVPGFVEFHLLKGPEAEDHTLYASHTVWESRTVFEAWTKSEAFRAAHSRAGDNRPLYLIIRSLRGSRFARRWGAARPRRDAYVEVAGVRKPRVRFCCEHDATDTLDWNKRSSLPLGRKIGRSSWIEQRAARNAENEWSR